MQVDEETDGFDGDDEFMSAVSCMSSPTSSAGNYLRPASGKSMDVHQYQQQGNRGSSSTTAQSQSYRSAEWDEDDDDETLGKNDERQKLLQCGDEQRQLHYPAPHSSPSLSACASVYLPLKGQLSSPPELVVEDHSRFDRKDDGRSDEKEIHSSQSHLNIPLKLARTRRSSSGSAISFASSASSNRSSYRSAQDTTARSSLVNGSVRNYPFDENEIMADEKNKSSVSEAVRERLLPSHSSVNEWHPDYLRPPLILHPLQENVLLTLLETCLQYACGLCVGVPVAVALLAWTCVVIPLRLLFYLITRWSVRGLGRWLRRRDHCDPLWPLGGSRTFCAGEIDSDDTTLLLATTQGGPIDVARIRQLLWRRLINLKDSSGYLSYSKLSSKLGHASEDSNDAGCCLATWSQDARFDMRIQVTTASCLDSDLNIRTLRDLESYINRLLRDPSHALKRKRPLWDVRALTDFGGSESIVETRCTLLIIRLHSAITDGCVCPLKCFTLINDGQLSFDCEPKMRGDDWAAFNMFITASFHMWHAFSIIAAGPISFLTAACRRSEDPVWTYSTGKSDQKFLGDLETGDGNVRERRFKATWARVPQSDQLLKVERILRCSLQELLLAFVAGALRRHFRSRGIKHPPDLQASVPVTFRDYMPISRTFPCNFVLAPVQLPLSVDGTIPRIWETQRRLCESLDSAYPRTARWLARGAGASLPKSWLRSIVASTHRASDGMVCFWRASGELLFADHQIHSLLIYPSLKRPTSFSSSAWSKYAFTFVQTGNEIVLSLMVDQVAFGSDPDVLLRHFQYEIHSLLSHMSPRMLTLSQATFLPSPLLITRLARSPLKIVSQANAVLASGSDADSKNERSQEDEPSTTSADSETLEELEHLMATVQNELQAMKTNPRGNRGDYILKLAELEMKMESFHQNIVDKLHRRRRISAVSDSGDRRQFLELAKPSPRRASSTSGAAAMDDENAGLLDPNFESLLQPLKADVQEAREGAMKLRRKRSRRLDSPTRLSPRCQPGSNQDDPTQRQRQRYNSSPSSSEIL